MMVRLLFSGKISTPLEIYGKLIATKLFYVKKQLFFDEG
jgi:hypothetical protein